MAIENVSGFPVGFVGEIGQIVLWMQAVGIVLIIWIIVQGAVFYFNRKRMREVYQIKKDMVRIERKIDKILSKKKNR